MLRPAHTAQTDKYFPPGEAFVVLFLEQQALPRRSLSAVHIRALTAVKELKRDLNVWLCLFVVLFRHSFCSLPQTIFFSFFKKNQPYVHVLGQ